MTFIWNSYKVVCNYLFFFKAWVRSPTVWDEMFTSLVVSLDFMQLRHVVRLSTASVAL